MDIVILIALFIMILIMGFLIGEYVLSVRQWKVKINYRKEMIEIREELLTMSKEESNSKEGKELKDRLKLLRMKYRGDYEQ